ncbi:MAG: biopolymer transporter ExbD [Magnetococcales bacterium]|nr:biopolymer transporter ExbD [Magnetococcales bacterium]MBF0437640.1 biopolymer transporter ExbD [Magnetococcales bacterium]
MSTGLFDADGEDRPLAEINVTPLVDVMLVLLVIFIILAPAMANSLKVSLPRATGESVLPSSPLTVVLRADGSTWIGEEPLESTVLAERLRTAALRDPDILLRIDGDGAVPYQNVAQLLSMAQGHGIHKIAFTTKAP